jgi:N-acetylglucosaminyl-diphospho-decaprenol L-rhamnosyltransferase
MRVNGTRSIVYLPDVEVIHYGRVSSRKNVAFADISLAAGHVRLLRKLGTSQAALLAYKLLVTCDAPIACAAKWLQYAWRRLRGGQQKAARSRLAALGTWYFLIRGLRRFWKT